MRRLLLFVVFLFFLNFLWTSYGDQVVPTDMQSSIEKAKVHLDSFLESESLSNGLDFFQAVIVDIVEELDEKVDEYKKEQTYPEQNSIDVPVLETPTDQAFTIYNTKIGEKKKNVELLLGSPKRIGLNEYGTDWHTYHENYHNFVKVIYDENQQVVGLYTNQDLIASSNGIKLNSSKQAVREALGEPLKQMQKGFFYYLLDEKDDYDIYKIDGNYVTIFYDKHENNTVTAVQIITDDIENSKDSMYTDGNDKLKEGFELQLFDLVNATRVNHDLPILIWDNRVRETARKHSLDMAENGYFDHTNLQGQTPFDRMKADGVSYMLAGENLAYGQFSSIFAHEGLMNSLGHRKNVIHPEFEYLAVGVAFNTESHPYYTQKYYAK
ncbi:CAP domain-containing protein [Cytobacillus sp. FJAT-54145]|uniref:CAP domain-containing protein n=1 Tax=Cytobacillus spartinae TaxID=3299023 RepID=A0ABW6K702_9BACI